MICLVGPDEFDELESLPAIAGRCPIVDWADAGVLDKITDVDVLAWDHVSINGENTVEDFE